MKKNKIKVIVFDFDDTLVISEHLKHQGYLAIFADIPNAAPIIRRIDQENMGQPRFVVIEKILQALQTDGLIKINDFKKELADCVKRYSNYVEKGILASKEIAGAGAGLQALSKRYALYLNSATPADFIGSVVKAKGWDRYFRKIYGAPPGTKSDHLAEIISQEKVPPSQVLVAGDSQSDYQAAKSFGANFIKVEGHYYKWSASEELVVIKDLKSFPELIDKF